MSGPALSVVCPLGPRRGRAERVLKAMSAQTAADSIELVLVDAGADAEALDPPPGIPTTVIPYPPGATIGAARALAVRESRGEIVAFMADHVCPDPGWAKALIAAFEEPVAAVGYAFRNANPESYGSRTSLRADFAPWLSPADSGETDHLPPSDVSYRRSALIAFGDELGELLTAEPLLNLDLRASGLKFALAGDATVSHACLRTIRDNAQASFDYCRALASIQARRQRWGYGRRLGQAILTAGGAPLVRTAGTMRNLAARPGGEAALRDLPAILLQHIAAALGQAWGYVTGGGDAAAHWTRWELVAERDDR